MQEWLVSRRIWILSVKLPEFLQASFRKVVERFFCPVLAFRIIKLSDMWVKGQPRPAEAAALSCVWKLSGGGGGNSPLVTRQAATGDI